MNIQIFYSIDSGLFLCSKEAGVLIDGLFTGEEFGWSLLPEPIVRQLHERKGIFTHCDAAIYTHDHPDHYNQAYFDITQSYPKPMSYYKVDGHSEDLDVERLSSGAEKIRVGDMDILVVDTIHDGKGCEKTPHKSLLVRCGEEKIFIPSDALMTKELIDFFAEEGPITAGFFNLYQLMHPRGQQLIRKLPVQRVFFYHLPFPEDDKYHYFDLAKRAKTMYPENLPPLEYPAPMSWVDGNCPEWAEQSE